jgi:DNA polymerase-3 subunit beta
MNFTVEKQELSGALQRVIGVVPTKTTIPILAGILLDLVDNQLTLTGTDLEVSISTSIQVHGNQDGGVAVPAKLLYEIVRELPEVPLQVESDESNRVTIKTDKGLYRIAGEPKEEFPRIVVQEGEVGFTLEVERLRRMINKTIFAVSTDELRTTLMGIFVQVLENELRFVTTDGHRLAKIVYKRFQAPEGNVREVIVPTKAFNLVLRNSEGAEKAEISLGENHIIFKLPQTVVYSKLIDGQFPNYERVIPTDNDKDLFVNRDQFQASVRRVSLFSNSMTRQVRLSLQSDQMEIQAEDLEFGGEASETISVRYSGDPMEIGYNATYVVDILRHMDTEEVVLRLKDPVSAGIIYPTEQEEDEELMMLLMPIRLYED